MYHLYDFFGVSNVEQKVHGLVESLKGAGIDSAVIGTMDGEPAVEFQTGQRLSHSDMVKFERMAPGVQMTSAAFSQLD
jgi:hypothetical protein